MEITEVRIKLMDDGSERLKAFCSITMDDCFVVRDLKIIEGTSGPFVAMPSRKLTAHCPQCGCKNHLRAAHCNQCGLRLKDDRAIRDEEGRAKLYADIAHPINSACREMIQQRVIEEYDNELERAKEPGYVSRYDEYDYDPPEPHIKPFAKPASPNSAESNSGGQIDAGRSGPPQPHDTGGSAPVDPRNRAKTRGSFGEGIL
ncbi:MAG: stage V sporulation protein G [Planctomycetota bacterium]|nr:MAG: stage V sporulation protein G [Planctomycetota bacterium]REJ97603.1 MAG: stage V sporulation protein G [Planctomycetota bacterium]REK23025.1 MAG: stage V sporulation protein G [Planctomycetota bacterium]REK43388.1 MAG: stage V sporulation protein G [Planctomycetota bacterium]